MPLLQHCIADRLVAENFVRSRGTKVPQKQMFHGTKVLGTFATEERKFHRSESSKERKFHGSESSLCGLFAPWNESAEERKGLESAAIRYAQPQSGEAPSGIGVIAGNTV